MDDTGVTGRIDPAKMTLALVARQLRRLCEDYEPRLRLDFDGMSLIGAVGAVARVAEDASR